MFLNDGWYVYFEGGCVDDLFGYLVLGVKVDLFVWGYDCFYKFEDGVVGDFMVIFCLVWDLRE